MLFCKFVMIGGGGCSSPFLFTVSGSHRIYIFMYIYICIERERVRVISVERCGCRFNTLSTTKGDKIRFPSNTSYERVDKLSGGKMLQGVFWCALVHI